MIKVFAYFEVCRPVLFVIVDDKVQILWFRC